MHDYLAGIDTDPTVSTLLSLMPCGLTGGESFDCTSLLEASERVESKLLEPACSTVLSAKVGRGSGLALLLSECLEPSCMPLARMRQSILLSRSVGGRLHHVIWKA